MFHFFLELYLDLYVFNKKNSDDSFAIKYRFCKISEKLKIEVVIKSSGNRYYSNFNCRKRG